MHSVSELADISLLSPFMLTVVGEWNAGKSTVINALVGRKVREMGIIPTTIAIGIVRGLEDENQDNLLCQKNDKAVWSKDVRLMTVKDEHDVDVNFVKEKWLANVSLVDTPGTNAVFTEHQALTEKFLPRCVMLRFVID